jgi:glycosyltransferase 2 family protein
VTKPPGIEGMEPVEPTSFAPLPDGGRRGWIKGLVRVVVGGAVFAILLATTDLGELGKELRNAHPGFIALAGVVFLVGLAISALRWREYLIALGIPFGYGSLFRLYFVGTFFNAFLPTGIGGDAYKAIRIGRGRPPGVLRNAFASVFLDRFAGVVGLALLGLTLSVSQLAAGGFERVPALGSLISAGILAAAALVLGPGEKLLGKGRVIPMEEGFGGKIRRMVRAVHSAGRDRRAFTLGLALGFAFQVTVLTFHLVITRALNITSVPLPALSSIVVISSMAVLIPLSVGGLGFLELSYRWTLSQYGVNAHRAIAFALLVRAVLLVTSAVGGVVYLIWGGEVSATEAGVTEGDPHSADRPPFSSSFDSE